MAKYQKLDAGKLLADVPDEYVFRCCDGSIYRNMKELRDGLEGISDETFAFHSNAEKNDFGNWVKDIIKDEKLGRDLVKSQNKVQATRSVAARVSSLSARLEPMSA
jgi:hypothetical protein